MSTGKQRREIQAVKLLSDPTSNLSHREVAQILCCSTKTIQRIAKRLKPDMDDAERKLERYRKGL